jgi:acetoin utilization protein AcuB
MPMCPNSFQLTLTGNPEVGNAYMIVRQWMTKDIVTISRDASIQDALARMRQHSIRHLPVVDRSNQLVGWISDADLRGALIASMLEELTVQDVMIHHPHTAAPDLPLEDAARLILEKRIRGLPVVEGKKLLGIITVVDILSAFITMMGFLTSSSRIDVRYPTQSTALDEITRVIQDTQAEIISICHLPSGEVEDRVYSFRLNKCDVDAVAQALREAGFEVVSSIS